ncbi:hypothetical protein L2E82_28641 [Cichorium intybus]|uniref:Uncharacterized protein n=1 Tax=Cichorium intybus TaxID=13427 RepID=A0ACB9CWC9_CICIN|nr:hypothetical protein L2E82_28641 [Cichorium intybus]
MIFFYALVVAGAPSRPSGLRQAHFPSDVLHFSRGPALPPTLYNFRLPSSASCEIVGRSFNLGKVCFPVDVDETGTSISVVQYLRLETKVQTNLNGEQVTKYVWDTCHGPSKMADLINKVRVITRQGVFRKSLHPAVTGI